MDEGNKGLRCSFCTAFKAFTLAEVLITLAIIGVVAALTIPAVVKNYKKHVMETQLKKSYSQILQAFNMAQAQSGDPKYWEIVDGMNGSGDFAQKYLFPYLKAVKNCGTSTAAPDCDYKYRYKNSTSWTTPDSGYTRFFLKDGQFIGMYTMKMSLYTYSNGTVWLSSEGQIPASVLTTYYPGFTYRGTSVTNSAGFLVDINGSKGPNVSGQDVFWFNFYGSGNSTTTPEGVTTENASNGKFVPGCFGNSVENMKTYCKDSGSCCADIIMANGWKVPDDYSWN
jgi:prepilin-type N-terminal cleavage/methylation domain-containing protein